MTKKITIPQQNQPFRRQSSLGGNVSFRNLGGTDNNNYVVMAVVTRVYYKQGRVDFKLTNSTNHVVTETGDGMGSAPIPVDFYGYQRNGKIFGHYRPIQIGDLIAVAYLWGHKQAPIVLGVYPKDSSSYEFVAPQEASSFGDDRDEATYDYALGDQKIFPDGSLEYHSGNGKYFKTLRGKSFMLLDDSPLYEHLWVGYNDIGAFKDSDQNTINPLQEEAGDWLLVHEDNNEGSNSTDHRTRFYVNKDGTFQVVLSKSSKLDNLVILEGSKSDGFTLQQLYNVPQKGWISEKDPHKEPDIKNAQQYVKFNIGGSDHSATIEAATKDDSVEQATKLEIKDDGIYVNDKPLISSNPKYAGKTIIDDTISNSEGLNDAINEARKASAAAESARQAGENAKDAGLAAERAANDALNAGDNIKKRIIYYASISKEDPKDVRIPGKYNIINTDTYIAKGTIKTAYIEDGAIDRAKIANEAVGTAQIGDAAITRGKIADLAVGTAQIGDAAITDAKIGSLSADKITTGTLDADKIKVVNLTADNIKAGSITADSLKIGKLSDITGDAGQITGGKIIVKGNGKNSGVSLEGLDADNPDVYTPSKKAALANIVHAIESSALASLDYAKQVGLSNDPVAIDLQNKYDAMVDGLAPIFDKTKMGVSTNFDHNTVEQLTSDCNNAIDTFQNLANSQLNRKIGQTADNKNSVYQGYEQPANPHINDIWFQENSDGTYQIRVYDGGSWISPGMQDIKEVQESVSTLPRSYYSYTQPTGTDYKDGDIWYKTSTDTTNNTVVYTAYKWNRNTNTWDPMLDATSSHNYVGSAPASPLEGDFLMDNTTLKQYQNGVWKTIPTQGPQGIPGAKGADGKTYYTWIKYATDSSGSNISDSPIGMSYIGIAYNKESSTESNVRTDYKWAKIKGEQGVAGTPGTDGKTPYVHIAYANSADGSGDSFTTDGTKASQATINNDPYQYMGTYVDYNQTSSQDHTMYKWTMIYDKSKKRNFTDQPTTPYNVGDTWTRSGATYFCTRNKLTGAFDDKDWKMQQLTIQSLDSNIQTNLKNSVKTTGNYKGVTLNDNGLTATAGSTTVAMNSNDGFLINNLKDASADNPGGQVFHVDTDGNLTMQGNITGGNISGVDFTGDNLTLNNSLHVINGSISADNGNVVINSNGLTLKNGGLSIIGEKDGKTTTTTWIRDDGTFSTIQGDFAGSVKATSLTLQGENAYMDVGAGRFHVDSGGNVTASNISITGNRNGDVSKLATIEGANITGNNLIQGNTITGNTIVGGTIRGTTINGSRFETNAHAQNYGSQPPYAGYGTKSGSLVSLGSWDDSGLVIRNNAIDLQKTLSWSDTDDTYDRVIWLSYPHNHVTGADNYTFMSNYGEDFQRLSGYDVIDSRNNNFPNHMFIPLLIVNNRKDLQSLDIDYYIRTNTDANVYMISWCTDLNKSITVNSYDQPEVTGMSTPPDRIPNENSLINKASMHRANDSIQLFSDSIDIGSKGSNNIGVGLWVEKVGSTGDPLEKTYVAGGSLTQVGKDHSWNLENNFQVHHQRTTITNNANFIQESYDESGASRDIIMHNGRLQLTNSEGPNVSTNTFRVDGSGISFSDNRLAMGLAHDNQKIAFLCDGKQGIYFDSYGNIHGLKGSGYWGIYDKYGTLLVDFPMGGVNQNNPIRFGYQTFFATSGETDLTFCWTSNSAVFNNARLPGLFRSDWWSSPAGSLGICLANGNMVLFANGVGHTPSYKFYGAG